MDRDTVIALAQEVWDTPNWNEAQTERLERFAALVAAHEREECAKVCDVMSTHPEYASGVTKLAAAAIRSRT